MHDAGRTPPLERSLWLLLAILSVAAITGVLVIAALRDGYPFELEWMEGATLDHVLRVRHGLDLYTAPGPDHVAFLYTPLLYYLGALLSSVVGEGFLALRLTGLLATAGCALLLARTAGRLGGTRTAGLLAAGLFAAGYGYLRSWYDLGRNDTLFLCLLLWTAHLLHTGGTRRVLAASVTAALAVLAKQTALIWLPALAASALVVDWRRGLRFLAAATTAISALLFGYHLATDGWFTFFVFEMPRGHAIQADRKLGFFTDDLVPMLPLLLLASGLCVLIWRRREWRTAVALAAFAGGGLLTSYLSRLHAGGFDNVMMYGFAACCALAPAAVTTARGQFTRIAGLLLLLVEFALLVFDVRAVYQHERPALLFDPRQWLPTAAHRQASEELVAFLRAEPGEVFVLAHGALAARAGKPPSAHAQAIFDLLQVLPDNDLTVLIDPNKQGRMSPRALLAVSTFYRQFTEALQARRWSAIVLDAQFGVGDAFEQLFAIGLTGYRRREGSPIHEPAALQPPIGMPTHSPYVLEPIR